MVNHFVDKAKTKTPEAKPREAVYPVETNGLSGNWASDDDEEESDDNSSLGEDDEKFASQLKGKKGFYMLQNF